MGCVLKLLENMRKEEKLKQKEHRQESGCLNSAKPRRSNPPLPSTIVEFASTRKRTTSSDRSSSCENSPLKPRSLKISAHSLTTKEKDLRPYWNDSCKEKSSQLWLPTKTVLQGLVPNLSNSLSLKTVGNSWFSIKSYSPLNLNLPKISLQYLPFSRAECTGLEGIKLKSKRIRIYPNEKQKIIFSKWFGATRFVYNHTVNILKEPGSVASWMSIKTAILHNLPEWAGEIPFQIKSIAIKDCCSAVSAAKLKFKKTGKINQISFKSRKDVTQSCFIPESAITEKGIYPRSTGFISYSESIPENHRDSRLIKENGRYYLCVPYPVQQRSENQANRIVALDPGVRTFVSFYSDDSCGKIGEGAFKRVFDLCIGIDKLISKLSNTKRYYERCNLKKKIGRLKWKIHDLIDELHFKTCRFLTNSFDVILLPTFEVSEMINKGKRKITSRTARSMLTLSHFKFKQRIKGFGKLVVDVNEAYTSKTASWSGEIVDIRSRKEISSCGITMDRDLNGARGIYLRTLCGDIR